MAGAIAARLTPTRCGHMIETMPSAKGAFLKKTPEVPRMGIGLAALGRPGYINLGHTRDLSTGKGVEEMRAHSWEVLDAAYAAGIRYFDAARSYGKSEEFLSGWLESRGHDPASLLVGSKWGYVYTADWQIDTGGEPHEVKEHTFPNLQKQTGESDALLGPFLDVYQIHSATKESGVLENKEVLEELARIKTEKGWRIGLTLSGVQQGSLLSEALTVKCPDGTMLFDCVQATWNLLEQSAGDSLLAAYELGMQVIVKEAMANGRLTPRNPDPAFQAKLEKLQEVATKLNTTVDALALACVMAQPFNAMVLSGAACIDHLESNYSAVGLLDQLDPATVSSLMEVCCTEPATYWTDRSNLSWN